MYLSRQHPAPSDRKYDAVFSSPTVLKFTAEADLREFAGETLFFAIYAQREVKIDFRARFPAKVSQTIKKKDIVT